MERGEAMLKVVEEVYEGGRDLIRNWTLLEHARARLESGGVEGLRTYYKQCLDLSDPKGKWIKHILERHHRKTLESEYARFLTIYRARSGRTLPRGARPAIAETRGARGGFGGSPENDVAQSGVREATPWWKS
jgi:hypothetical protein